MTTATIPNRFTPADVLRLEDDGLYELVNGKLVEKQMGSVVSQTIGIVIGQLHCYLKTSPVGSIYLEQSFHCFPHDSDLIRRPDVSFVANERVSIVATEGHVEIAPDLAIEVVSRNDKVYALDEKLSDYRAAGVKLVWVINPNSRTLRIHRADHSFDEMAESDRLSGESVLPGFSILVKDLLPAPVRPAAPHPPTP